MSENSTIYASWPHLLCTCNQRTAAFVLASFILYVYMIREHLFVLASLIYYVHVIRKLYLFVLASLILYVDLLKVTRWPPLLCTCV